jgi:response regulator RpfG family c-di-GMP phosphodiesterase
MKKSSVLVVGNDPTALDIVSRELKRNFRVITATSYGEGLRAMGSEQDVVAVVADTTLGHGPGGLEILREICFRSPECVRVLLATVLSRPELGKAMNEGVLHAVVQKPWVKGAVREVLERRLNGAR